MVNLRTTGTPTRTAEQIYKENIKLLDMSQIYIQNNIRREYDDIDDLIDSIRIEGLLHPITVIRDTAGMYYILIGHRRYLAFQKLYEEDPVKFSKIPVIVKNSVDEVHRLEIQIMENEQRNNFKPIELAFALKELKEKTGKTNDEIAKKVGKKEKWVRDHLSAVTIVKNIILQDEESNEYKTVVDDDFKNSIPDNLKDIPITSIIETKGIPTDIQKEILQNRDLNQKDIRDLVNQIKKDKPKEDLSKSVVKKNIKKTTPIVTVKIDALEEDIPKRTIKNIDTIYKKLSNIIVDEDIRTLFHTLLEKINAV